MGKAEAESGAIVDRILDFLQGDRRIRLGIGLAIIGVLMYFGGRAAYGLVPRQYTLSLTGGDIVSNRHYLARLLERESSKQNLDLIVKPTSGTLAAFEAVSRGDIDAALVQGGVDEIYPNIEHVAMVTTEYVHLLVKPGIKRTADLRGRSINLDVKPSATREIGRKITEFAGFIENVDYVEENYSAEELLALPDHKMPDAIFTVSTSPSFLVEVLVRERGYLLMEIAFPQSLALRQGWAGNGTLLSYTYNLTPPVPEKDITTVAVNMYLIANKKADPDAIERLLETLYSPSIATAFRAQIDEAKVATPSGYPMSRGLSLFQKRKDSIFTREFWAKLQGIFALVMTFGGTLIVVLKWFKGPEPKPIFDDAELFEYLGEVAKTESVLAAMESSGRYVEAALIEARDAMSVLRTRLLERAPKLKLKDPTLFDRCATSVREAHDLARSLVVEARKGAAFSGGSSGSSSASSPPSPAAVAPSSPEVHPA